MKNQRFSRRQFRWRRCSVSPVSCSVIPCDPWQLLFLTGTIFLLISPRFSWLQETLLFSYPSMRGEAVDFYGFILFWLPATPLSSWQRWLLFLHASCRYTHRPEEFRGLS